MKKPKRNLELKLPLCDNCKGQISIYEYKTNKGFCDYCIKNKKVEVDERC